MAEKYSQAGVSDPGRTVNVIFIGESRDSALLNLPADIPGEIPWPILIAGNLDQ